MITLTTWADLEDFARRTAVPAPALEALALAGAFGGLGAGRREALWAAGAAATIRAGQLPGSTPGLAAPALPAMTAAEETFADLWATGTYGTHPIAHIRELLAAGLSKFVIRPSGRQEFLDDFGREMMPLQN